MPSRHLVIKLVFVSSISNEFMLKFCLANLLDTASDGRVR